VLSSLLVRKAFTSALLLGLALAVLAPALATAGPAADCGMSCCRLGLPMASHHGIPGCAGGARCSMRGCGSAPQLTALFGLPPTLLPALLPHAALAFAAPLSQAAFRLPVRFALDLPDRPPRG
jgi:hypothetical protein